MAFIAIWYMFIDLFALQQMADRPVPKDIFVIA